MATNPADEVIQRLKKEYSKTRLTEDMHITLSIKDVNDLFRMEERYALLQSENSYLREKLEQFRAELNDWLT